MFGVQKSLLAESCHRPMLFLSSWSLESLLQSPTSPITGVIPDHSCRGLPSSCCRGTHTFCSSIPSLHSSSRSSSWTVHLIVSNVVFVVCLFCFCFIAFSPWINPLFGFVPREDDISDWKKKLSYSDQFSVLKHSRLPSHVHREGRTAHLSPVDLRFQI